MSAKKLDALIGDAWKDEATEYYLNNHTMQETLVFINTKYAVSDRSLRNLLRERNINRGVSGAQKLKRFKCHCGLCHNDFVGRTPTSVMCDDCIGDGAVGVTKERLKKYQYLFRISSYGITVQQYEEMLKSQNDECGLCAKKMKQPCVDHCHETGNVRGLLCHRCNLLLGQVELAGKFDWLKRAERWIGGVE